MILNVETGNSQQRHPSQQDFAPKGVAPSTPSNLGHLQVLSISTSESDHDATFHGEILLTTANYSILHSFAVESQPYGKDSTRHREDMDVRHIQHLFGGLLLFTLLACLAAYDANHQCQSLYAFDVYDQFYSSRYASYMDNGAMDENGSNRENQSYICGQMFYSIVLPVGIIVMAGGFLGYTILRCYTRPIVRSLEEKNYLYRLFQKLSIVILVIIGAWIFGIVSIILQPKDAFNNPYQSLGALDVMGHVGENANLYYTTWISLGFSIALAYQVFGTCFCLHTERQRLLQRLNEGNVGNVEAMLYSNNIFQFGTYHESRAMWYRSLYRLRTRTGIWAATFLATLMVLASSVHIWLRVLFPTAISMNADVSTLEVCETLKMSDLPFSFCTRTAVSLCSGALAALLSFCAIVTHLLARWAASRAADVTGAPWVSSFNDTSFHMKSTRLIQFEFLLAVLLSSMLGINAIVATAVHGPAAPVGNLYYANWTSFLLCLRISLGCLEELCTLDISEDQSHPKSSTYDSHSLTTSAVSNIHLLNDESLKKSSKERSQRTRLYIVLGISSTVCSASALDAAMYEVNDLRLEQRIVITFPSIVAVLCACQFLLCLRSSTYKIVSQIWLGGLLSTMKCAACFLTLAITMHSETSWAVNNIGEIEIANLYYFTWASTVTAGLLMTSYVKDYLHLKEEDLITAIWVVLCKVCFIILAAGYHVWHSISGACTMEEIRSGAVSFCSRTVVAILIAFSGMIVSASIAVIRVMIDAGCPSAKGRARARVELVAASLMMILFAIGVATITGIGGPGQSVGDLFYGSWMAFLVSLGLFLACLEELYSDDQQSGFVSTHPQSEVI
jgi:hypothetical protein